MAKAASRFHADDLVGDGTAPRAGAPAAAPHVQHKPIVLRKAVERTVDSRIAELERQLAERDSEKEGLSSELAEAKAELERLRAVPSADEGEELLLLDPDLVVDKLPKTGRGVMLSAAMTSRSSCAASRRMGNMMRFMYGGPRMEVTRLLLAAGG